MLTNARSSKSAAPLDADSPFRELVFSDLARYRGEGARGWLRVLAVCSTDPGMIASVIIRAQQALSRRGPSRLARMLRTVATIMLGADLSPGPRIGPGFMMPHPSGVCIGFDLVIGSNVTFAGGVTCGARYPDPRMAGFTPDQKFARIGDNVTIGAHAVIVGEVHIGDNALVGAHTLVTKDVPESAVMFGIPARKIGVRDFTTDEPTGL
ncbi:serine O-acetyltransferase [Marmoricola sp. RAF53]|uniref:serine O-acetyltransferase n=1 Tax=Marmoricola sp. RAF53 TaxID=3233059 RepID=UPI003F976191